MPNIKSAARFVALFAIAYALIGAVGLRLAIPPGYASPVFPAAGLALAGVLFFDRRVLIGVWLGSILLNVSHTCLFGTLNWTAVAASAAIATGAAVQAWAGGGLVNRWAGLSWRDMEREQDAVAFLLVGGLLASVLSPSVGVTAMYAAGIIESSELSYTWWNWYVGDALGVLVFAPLILSVLNRKSLLWRQRRRLIVVPMLVTLSLVCLVFYGTAHWEKDVQNNQLAADSEIIAKRITDRLITHREVLSSLKHFIEATPNFSFEQFEQYTLITLADNPDIFALSFNDVVSNDRRAAFEKMMSGLSPLGRYQITERDDHGNLVCAATRSEYVAVRYIVPLLNNKLAVGYDINSEPIRKDAIDRARALGSMTVTAPLQLVQEHKKRVGILELLPVTGKVSGNPGDRAIGLIGFAVGVVKIDQTIEIATLGHVPTGLVFQLIDTQAPDGHGLLYCSETHGAENIMPVRAGYRQTGLRMGDRHWKLSVYTTAGYQKQHRPWIAWAVGVAGLMFASLLQVLMLGMTGRTAMIQRKNEEIQFMANSLEEKVIARTTELNATMQSYRNQFVTNSSPMLMVDPLGGDIIDVNSAAIDFYGYPRERMLTMNITEINTLPASEIRQAMASVLQIQGKRFEFQHRLADGSVRNVEESSSLIHFGERAALHVIIQDITERKSAEEALMAALQEKEVLLREVHHRVKNNMQVISSLLTLQADRVENEQARQALFESQQRINTMAMIHEALYSDQNLNTIDLAVYLKRLVDSLQAVYSAQADVRIVLELDKVELGIDQAVPCGLIINELVSNAFKHAFPKNSKGMIQIRIFRENEREMVLAVSDNGVGFSKEVDISNPSSLGLRLVRGLLTHQLKGSLVVSHEGGTAFSFRWSLPSGKREDS